MDANWFQQAFDRAGVTQADLARHLRLAPSAVSRMLKGERQMKLLEAVQVANFLGVLAGGRAAPCRRRNRSAAPPRGAAYRAAAPRPAAPIDR